MTISIPSGAWPILLTPFRTDGKLDLTALDDLLDFYLRLKVPGILILGQASEVLALNNRERFMVAQRVAERLKGMLCTVAVGNFGDTLQEQAVSLEKIASLGIEIPLVALSLLPSPHDLDGQLMQLAEKTIHPLGIYELPEPEHRLLNAAQVARIARSGRYFFMKDTCRQVEPFTSKVVAARGTLLKIFQANLKILPSSLEVGSHGFCGWMPIVAPELAAQVCDQTGTPPEIRRRAFDKLLEFHTFMVKQGFPASAKYILEKRGLKLGTRCRVRSPELFSKENMVALDNFLARQDWFATI